MHFLFLDIETTGLDQTRDELLELSAVRVSSDFTKELGVFDKLVHPGEGISIPPFITKLTGISDDMVKDAPHIDTVRDDFAKYLQPGDIITGHNIMFDVGFLRAKGFSVPNDTLDTFSLSNILLPDEESYSLEILTKKYGIEHTDAHRALADVRANLDLFKILFDRAKDLSSVLQEKYAEFLERMEWSSGKRFFEMAFLAAKKEKKKEVFADDQLSLFGNSSQQGNDSSRLFSQGGKPPCSLRGENSQQCTDLVQNYDFSEDTLVSLAPEISELDFAVSLAHSHSEKTGESVYVAVPKLHAYKTPDGFVRFSSPDRIFCHKAFEKWKSIRTSFSESDITAAFKVLRELESHSLILFPDLPMLREEWDIARNWFSKDHSDCSEGCVIGQLSDSFQKKNLLFGDIYGLASSSVKNIIIPHSDSFSSFFDSLSRKTFSLKSFERKLENISSQFPVFSEKCFFALGLLKRFVRERVGESPYREFYTLKDSDFSLELSNLVQTFSDLRENIPQDSFAADIDPLLSYFSSSAEEGEMKCLTIYPDDNLSLTTASLSLRTYFDQFFDGKKSLFLGKNFSQKFGKYVFGYDLPTPEKQETIPSQFDFSSSQFFVPTVGGNTKMDSVEKTADCVRKFLSDQEGNMLVLFPSANLIDRFVENIGKEIEDSDFELVVANGSAGKITSQVSRGKTVLVCAGGMLNRLDLPVLNISLCIQHRLLFAPPPDPIESARYGEIKNEFSEIALPNALKKFTEFLHQLIASEHPFTWICLDAHFQKSGGFADGFLRSLPGNLPIVRGNVMEVRGELGLNAI